MRARSIRNLGLTLACAGLILSAGMLSGCGTTQPVTSWTNMKGQRTDLMGDNLLDVPGQVDTREMLWLNAFREVLGPQEMRYHLQVTYGARKNAGPLEINPGRSLIIIADGQELSFSGLGSLEQEEERNAIFEKARYDATADDIARIAFAKKVVVRVVGRNGIVVREFGEENFENFRKFARMTGADL